MYSGRKSPLNFFTFETLPVYFSGKSSVHTTGAQFPTEDEFHGHRSTIYCVVSKQADVMHKKCQNANIFITLCTISFTLTQKTSAFYEFLCEL